MSKGEKGYKDENTFKHLNPLTNAIFCKGGYDAETTALEMRWLWL